MTDGMRISRSEEDLIASQNPLNNREDQMVDRLKNEFSPSSPRPQSAEADLSGERPPPPMEGDTIRKSVRKTDGVGRAEGTEGAVTNFKKAKTTSVFAGIGRISPPSYPKGLHFY